MNLALTESNTVSSHLHTLYITYLKWPSTHKINSFFFFFLFINWESSAQRLEAHYHTFKKMAHCGLHIAYGCSFQQTTLHVLWKVYGMERHRCQWLQLSSSHVLSSSCLYICGWIPTPTHIMCIRTTELFVAMWPATEEYVVGVTELTPFAQFHCMIREGGGATWKCWPARQKNPVLIFTHI